MSSDTERMKAELVDAGYVFVEPVNYGDYGFIEAPNNALTMLWDYDDSTRCIEQAHAHMQAAQELAALRQLADTVDHWLGGQSLIRLRSMSYRRITEFTAVSYEALIEIGKAYEATQEFNITADDESDSDE